MKFSVKFKANKAFKTFKILLIIFLCIALLIGILNYFDLYQEGFSSNEELANYNDISNLDKEASCSSQKEDTDTAVPACYATLQPNRGNDYLHHDDSDYILKTEIETPVCPNNPFEYGNNGFGSLLNDDNSIVTPGDSWLQRSIDVSQNSFNMPENNIIQNSVPENNTALTTESTPSELQSPYIIQEDLAVNSAQNNASGLNDLNLNYPTLNPTPEPSQPSTNTPTSEPTTVKDDKCPPCPACERCPEPVVECKKVVNYSTASNTGQLPVPYINDFSKF
jgi:hypothetical protein